ncbi:hypothetical protein MBEHAL_1317 [Halarchaeum acidiphilum MH1-52-1]|uniref:DUF7973 domain-containing protein n=1 Tax=Halarchaeum acidiphilum MH1-52-1 TaxID=1261545 RepID=U2YUV5_9EURY|nr:hypothetical protein [Halarchaeum acidiphilum]GAD52557.1 hypothetical protein MBEHAL_1317 [Halarchaeum acidiphilum MH1-52-1]
MIAPLQIPVIGMDVESFLVVLIAALAGGAFGASLGALPSFVFTGFVVMLGEGVSILQSQLNSLDAIHGGLAAGITGTIGFGMVVGPHVGFAGGVAASAYVGKKYPEMNPNGWDYHLGKDISSAFGTKPDILAVGALFGALGMLITQIAGGIGFPTDNIALSVFLTAVIARLVFDYPLIGTPAGDGVFDMSPFERGEPRDQPDDVPEGNAGRLAVEPWLGHQYKWVNVTAIGLVGGILGGYIWLKTGSVFLGYGISAASLLFLNLGVAKIPVTHHLTLIGVTGAMLGSGLFGSTLAALIAAGVFGALAGVVGEATQRIFYAHSGTHVDPPAMSITVIMLVVGVLYLLGVLPNAGYLGL